MADVNKDGYPDLFFGRRAAGIIALSDGKGHFRTAAVTGESDATVAAQFVDYDNDGLVDLMTVSDRGARLFRNIGGDGWSDASAASRLNALAPSGTATFQALVLGDVDGDGDDDVVVRQSDGRLRLWRNDGGERSASLRVRLTGRVSNRSALGAKVDLRAGSLRQTIETASASPAFAPADVIFGLAARTGADAVRIVWPSGIVQAETPASSTARSAVLPVTELDRKPSSCPFLFTWNGTGFEFVTDFMGGGEMGDWVAPSVWNQPDPDEYVRIGDEQLKPRDGRYELRIPTSSRKCCSSIGCSSWLSTIGAASRYIQTKGYVNRRVNRSIQSRCRYASAPRAAVDEHGHDVTRTHCFTRPPVSR